MNVYKLWFPLEIVIPCAVTFFTVLGLLPSNFGWLLAIRRVYIFWSGGSTRSRTWRVSQEFLMQTFHDEWPSICWLVFGFLHIYFEFNILLANYGLPTILAFALVLLLLYRCIFDIVVVSLSISFWCSVVWFLCILTT